MDIGVIGVGAMGKNHVRVYSELKSVSSLGIYDVNTQAAKILGEKHDATVYGSIGELLDNCDAVSVVVPDANNTNIHSFHPVDSIADISQLLPVKQRVNRYAQDRRCQAGRYRTGVGFVCLGVYRLVMNGNRVVHSGSNTLYLQVFNKISTLHRKFIGHADYILVIHMVHALCYNRSDKSFDRNVSVEILGVFPAPHIELFQLFQLYKTDSRSHISHAVIVSNPGMEVFLALPMVDEQAKTFV